MMKLNISIGSVTATLIDDTSNEVLAEYTIGNASVFVSVDKALEAIVKLFNDE